ncbi:MAG TPA: STAS domain-containing protein [Candidatus Binatia bacterium]|jgi:anti-anti-sigma factor
MEIGKQQIGDVLELWVRGRLDSYWADHLLQSLDDAVREGARNLRLNLSEVSYLSSAGIRVLVRTHKQLSAIQGCFSVSEPSEAVRSILQLTGLMDLLVPAGAPGLKASPSSGQILEKENIRFEVINLTPQARLSCRVIGDPEPLFSDRIHEENCWSVAFSDSSFGLGLGAFGSNFAECAGRFGEFLAACGAVTYLPADGTNVPDYMLAAGNFVPRIEVLYSILCEGDFKAVVDFERKNVGGAANLSEIIEGSLEILGAEALGIVMITESAGLIGTALRRSPALRDSQTALFDFPQVRDWLSFVAEPVHTRALALVVGVAARTAPQPLPPLLRPLGKPALAGHFHAAVFSYRPVKKRELDLRVATANVFEIEAPQALLHLLHDNREITGAGESRFARGTCWIGPIADVDRSERIK